ncbi:beta-ketoacyl synthase N-terminal-like domain-containing protein [Streptomyces sp. NPDC050703]|uniref:beta-ketoacyl synthase N-terminal-like domain-containing protein n=1 Tax=Streptomyces sp. NPDC050703 TaxID=3157218 RepID=UPI003443EFF9
MTTQGRTTEVAVIGMACRFPGARDAGEFWRNLVEGRDTVTRVTGPRGTAARGLLDDPERFDADYFGMSPREARLVNPQHRVFLECAVEALENAGVDPARHPGTAGVYGGGSDNAYAHLLTARGARRQPVSAYEIRMGNGADFLCSRVAYKLGLRGPTVAVQAGCATSLVAVHLAVQGLLSGDCDLALAGGVTVRHPFVPDEATEAGIQAPDGVCRAFDADARGAVGADGVGLVVLKRLDRALADGDRIDAVVMGCAVNNDGAERLSFAAPGVEGQAAVVEAAHRAAGIDPATCTYVEAHGTGTPLGDPVEIAALTRAFGRGGERAAPCGIGSVKTGIGHTDAAAGAAGLIKTVLALKHGLLPPSLHFSTPNPHIDFDSGPFRVVTELRTWRPGGVPRRAGVSSFSLGGTNAHVVLEQAPAREPAPAPGRSWHVLPLSAKDPAALERSTARLAAHLRAGGETPLAALAWTLQTGRTEHQRRRFAVVDGAEDAVRVLSGERPDRLVGAAAPAAPEPVVFRCATVPSADMARERAAAARLYAAEPVFRSAVAACAIGDALAESAPAWTLTFATRCALARLWQRWGVVPAAVVGEGTAGVLAAAVVAGVFEPAEAGRLAAGTTRRGPAHGGDARADVREAIRRIGPRAPALPLWVTTAGKSPRRLTPDEALDPTHWSELLTDSAPSTTATATAGGGAGPRGGEVPGGGAGPRGGEVAHGGEAPGGGAGPRGGEVAHGGEAPGGGAVANGGEAPGAGAGPGGGVESRGGAGPGGGAEPFRGHGTCGPAGPGQGRGPRGVPLDLCAARTPVGERAVLDAVGRMWLAGARIDWAALHGAGTPERVALPAYPFAGRRYTADTDDTASEQRPAPAGGPAAVPAQAAAPGPASGGDDADRVAALFAEILELPQVDPDESFFDLGGDSLIAAKFVARANEVFLVDLVPRTLFRAPTAQQLAAVIAERLTAQSAR